MVCQGLVVCLSVAEDQLEGFAGNLRRAIHWALLTDRLGPQFRACRSEAWKQKGYLFPHHRMLPTDFSNLMRGREEREGEIGGRRRIAGRARWWGRTERQKLQSWAAESLGHGRDNSKSLAWISTERRPRSVRVAQLASLCHRAITYIISPKITQSNLHLPISSLRSLLEMCFNK